MGLPAVIAASTAVGAVASIQSGNQAAANGNYQQSIANQNAEIYETKAERSEAVGEYNVKRFEKDFTKQFASVERAYAFSGVDVSRGTPLAMMEEYLMEAEMEKANITYNAKIEATDYREAAVNSRMEGQVAQYRGNQARIGSYFSAGRTLLGGATDIMSVNKYSGMNT
jgi:hypothetical protein|tara:strand:+ start:326 stop:832 length:507 start_codon:yes stop_codon:yes gene_type:complete